MSRDKNHAYYVIAVKIGSELHSQIQQDARESESDHRIPQLLRTRIADYYKRCHRVEPHQEPAIEVQAEASQDDGIITANLLANADMSSEVWGR